MAMPKQSNKSSATPQKNSLAAEPNKERSLRDYYEKFRASLPYPTVPTNIPGVFATAPLPHDFDPRSASRQAMLKHGLLWRRPEMNGGNKSLREAWDRAFSAPWFPEKCIVPEMQIHRGRTHRRRSPSRIEGSDDSSDWSGAVVNGLWGVVTGSWQVPSVIKGSELVGGADAWRSLAWIGIGGSNNEDDLIQVGTVQNVDSDGNASYGAFYEWYVQYIRVTLDDTTPSNFGLCSNNNGDLFLAFRGEGNHLDILFSSDHGNTFGNKLTSHETTSAGPALVFHDSTLLVSWIGPNNNRLNVAEVGLDGNTISLSNKVTLEFTSARGPALASFNGVLYLAWKDEHNHLAIAASQDGGATFGTEYVSDETSTEAPALTVHNAQLMIGWKGDGNDDLNVATVTTDGTAATGIVGNVTVSPGTSPLAPSLASLGGVLYLSWKGDGNDHLNLVQSTDGGQTFIDQFTSFETSPSSPILAVHENRLFIGWRGEQDHLDLGVVGIRGGEIVGFSPNPAYLDITTISNFPVRPADTMIAAVLYSDDLSAGYVALGNLTTGDHFAITLAPPPAADISGSSMEWIMEAEGIDNKPPSMPQFLKPVVFASAAGCGPNNAVGNPADGASFTFVDSNGTPVTLEELFPYGVTISYIE